MPRNLNLDQKWLNDIKHAGAFKKKGSYIFKKDSSGWTVANGLKKKMGTEEAI